MEPTQNKKFDYVNAIIQFNTDPEIIALREKYSDPSFFEVISKERSETTYSAFLKWVFQDCAIGKGTVSPILQLLNILVKRDQEQKDGREYNGQKIILIKDNLRDAILSGSVQIKTINVDTELSIAEYLERLDEEGGNLQEFPKEENGKSQNTSQKDNRKKKLDIFIDCDVEINGSNYQRLQIIIENKIDSKEGQNQTKCYYENTKRKQEDNILQLYVYLSPLASNKLTNLYQKKEEKLTTKKDSNEKLRCESEYFIHINYQDILDCIITPLLASNSISSRSRFFLEEFKSQLTYPNLESGELSIAVGQENIKQFTDIYRSKKYQQLIIDSAIAYSGKPFQWADNSLKDLKNKGSITFSNDETACLFAFWEQNSKLLLAIMNGMEAEERRKIEALIKIVSSRKKSKYQIYIASKLISGKEPVGNAMAAKVIIQAWANKQNEPIKLQDVCDKFPRNLNPYYDKYHTKLSENLFHQYDSTHNYKYDYTDIPPSFKWDFDRGTKYIIELNGNIQKEPDKIIILKSWQKNAIVNLINHVITNKLIKDIRIDEVFNGSVINTWSSSKK